MSDHSLSAKDPPCHAKACAIQTCLQKNSYDESKCTDKVLALYECCWKLQQESQQTSVSCPKPSLLKLKMQQIREEERKEKG